MAVGELDGVRRRQRAAAEAALAAIGEDLLGEAQRRAPVEEGTLRGSGFSDLVRVPRGADLYVGFATPYAARQHEEVEYRHPLGGQAKYLESVVLERHARYHRILALAVRKVT